MYSLDLVDVQRARVGAGAVLSTGTAARSWAMVVLQEGDIRRKREAN
jgi:hypothetical protein